VVFRRIDRSIGTAIASGRRNEMRDEPIDHGAEREHNVTTGSNEVDAIRREMARVRRELHADVQGVVSTAEAATDWRHYITAYPWISLGLATAVGYLIVPRRKESATSQLKQASEEELGKIRELIAQTQQNVAKVTQTGGESKRGKGLISAALGLAAPLVIRAAQGYVMKFLENWILQQQMSHTMTGPLDVPDVTEPGPDTVRAPRRGGVSP